MKLMKENFVSEQKNVLKKIKNIYRDLKQKEQKKNGRK
jgi:hypothetical protein